MDQYENYKGAGYFENNVGQGKNYYGDGGFSTSCS